MREGDGSTDGQMDEQTDGRAGRENVGRECSLLVDHDRTESIWVSSLRKRGQSSREGPRDEKRVPAGSRLGQQQHWRHLPALHSGQFMLPCCYAHTICLYHPWLFACHD